MLPGTALRCCEDVDHTDTIACREVKPDHHKNIIQDAADKTGRSKDNVKHGGTGQSMYAKLLPTFLLCKIPVLMSYLSFSTHKIKDAVHPTHPVTEKHLK